MSDSEPFIFHIGDQVMHSSQGPARIVDLRPDVVILQLMDSDEILRITPGRALELLRPVEGQGAGMERTENRSFPFRVGETVLHPSQGEVQIVEVGSDVVIFRMKERSDTFRVSRDRAIEILRCPRDQSQASTQTEQLSTEENIAPADMWVASGDYSDVDKNHSSSGNGAPDDSDESVEDSIENNLSAYVSIARPYQVEALRALSKDFARRDSLLLALPTGSGKTFVAVKWIADHVIRQGGRVIWVAHRHELLEQAYVAFINLLPPEETNAITWWVGGKPKSADGRIVLVSVAASRNFPQMNADLLVIDEAHHEPASTYQQLKEKIQYKKHLGLTATPQRLDQKALGYETIAYQRSFMSLVEEGWLSRPMPVLPKTGLDFRLWKSTINDDFAEESLSQLDSDRRNRFIAEHWKSNADRYGKTLVFAVNRNHARRLVETFRAVVPEVESDYIVSGETLQEDRREKLEEFRNGRIQILVNCRIFTEGFDCPDVRTIFLTRPTLSSTLYLQMVGRGTRITPTKDSFYLVDFEDNLGDYQEQLVKPWILNEDQMTSEPVHRNRDREKIDELPRWAQEELELSEVDLNDIVGYVEHDYHSGRRDGFLVHAEDEEQFLSLWKEFAEAPVMMTETAAARRIIDAYEIIRPRRLALTHVVSALVALTRKKAWYTSLVRHELSEQVLAFIKDARMSDEELANLQRSQSSIYALIKFTEDEIDRDVVVRTVYESEQPQFAKALQALDGIRSLRGINLRRAVDDVYINSLVDTHLTSFEWERFAIQWLTNAGQAILLDIQDKPPDSKQQIPERSTPEHLPRISNPLALLLMNRRIELGYTQETIASQVGVGSNYIGYLERGARRPSDDLIPKLAKALRLDELTVYFTAYPRIEELVRKAETIPQEGEYGRIIEVRRRALDWTQEDVAVRVGVRANYIGYLEKGERHPSDDVADKLARVLGVDELTLLLAAHPPIRQLLIGQKHRTQYVNQPLEAPVSSFIPSGGTEGR